MATKATYAELQREVKALRKIVSQNEYIEKVYQSIAVPVMILDPDQNILSVNLATEKQTGSTSDDLKGKKCYQVFHNPKATVPPHSCPFRSVVAHGKDETVVMEEKASNGILLVSLTPVYDDNNVLKRVIHISTDITEQRLVERKLQESESKFRNLVNNLPGTAYQFVLTSKGDLRFDYIGESCIDLFGISAKEVLKDAHKVFDLIPKPDADMVNRAIVDSARSLTPYKVKYRVVKGNGETVWIYASSIPRKLTNGDIIWDGIGLDITENKQFEKALKESEEEFRSAFENSAVGMVLVDQKGRYRKVNKALSKILGYTEEELLSMSVNAVSYPGEPTQHSQMAKKLWTGESNGFEIEKRYVHKDGHIVWGAITVSPVHDANGNTILTLGQIQDITKRKQAETALQESETQFRSLFEQAGDGLAVYDAEGNIMDVNHKLCTLFEYSKDEFCKLRVFDTHPPDSDAIKVGLRAFEQLLSSGYVRFESDFITKSGRIINGEVTSKLVETGDTKLFYALFKDISARKRAENKILNKERDLKKHARRLQEMNTALKVLLDQREQEKRGLEGNMLTNVQKLVYPYINKIKMMTDNELVLTYLDIVESNLKDFMSPMAKTLTSIHMTLTPTEIQVCDLVKQGKTSKEIALLMGVSKDAISVHRFRIRKKLGLLNSKANLRSYLQNLAE